MNEALKGTAVDKHPLSSWLLFQRRLRLHFFLESVHFFFFLFLFLFCSLVIIGPLWLTDFFIFEQKPIREASHIEISMALFLILCSNSLYNSQEISFFVLFFAEDLPPTWILSVSMFTVFLLLYLFMSIGVSMCSPSGLYCVETLQSIVFFSCIHVYVCACVLLRDIWSLGSPHATLACRWSVRTWGPTRFNIS